MMRAGRWNKLFKSEYVLGWCKKAMLQEASHSLERRGHRSGFVHGRDGPPRRFAGVPAPHGWAHTVWQGLSWHQVPGAFGVFVYGLDAA